MSFVNKIMKRTSIDVERTSTRRERFSPIILESMIDFESSRIKRIKMVENVIFLCFLRITFHL